MSKRLDSKLFFVLFTPCFLFEGYLKSLLVEALSTKRKAFLVPIYNANERIGLLLIKLSRDAFFEKSELKESNGSMNRE